MGIPGLLGALKSVTFPVHISEYRGLTAGVDAYCWLHRGAFSCGTELCTGVATDKYVAFCMKRVNLLLHHGVNPIMVFDGASLPVKRNKNIERKRQRDSARSKGEEALAAGEKGAAAQHFSKAVGVTHDMAFQFIKALRQAGVQLMVAPYESDAQLAFLSRTGVVDVVITEDSDCLPYGCKKVLFKMDNDGHGQEIQLRNLAANTPLSLCNWRNSMFLDLCLLVGCDYIDSSIKGLGIATAHKLVDTHRSLDKIIQAVNSSKFIVPEEYWEKYKMARITFRHHIIYNPETETTRYLMPLGDTAKGLDLGFLGAHLQPAVAKGVSLGFLLPTSHKPYEAAAPLARSAPCSPSLPKHEASGMLDDVNPAPLPSPAEAADCFDVFDDRLEAELVERTSERDSKVKGYPAPSVYTSLSGLFIDNPFSTARVAPRELPYAASTGVAWGVASHDLASAWTTQDNLQSLNMSESRSRFGPPSQAENDSTGYGVIGVSTRSAADETLRRPGLDLTRIRGAESPADPLSSAGALFRGTPSSCAGERETGRLSFSSVAVAAGLNLKEGGNSRVIPDWQAEQSVGALHRATATEDTTFRRIGRGHPGKGEWRRPLWKSASSEKEGAPTRNPEKVSNDIGAVQDEPTRRGPDGLETTAEHTIRVGVRKGNGVTTLSDDPAGAGQGKFVPASAQNFYSTQVSRGLETLQRRKRRLHPGVECSEKQQESQPDEDCKAPEEAIWMVQQRDVDQGFHEESMLSTTSECDPKALLSPRSPGRRLRAKEHVEKPGNQALTASSRRWTLPPTVSRVSGVELPLLRLLDQGRQHSWHGQVGGTLAAPPSAKRTRGTDFWDAQLLR